MDHNEPKVEYEIMKLVCLTIYEVSLDKNHKENEIKVKDIFSNYNISCLSITKYNPDARAHRKKYIVSKDYFYIRTLLLLKICSDSGHIKCTTVMTNTDGVDWHFYPLKLGWVKYDQVWEIFF